MQPDVLWFGSVKKISLGRFFHIGAEVFLGLALSEIILREAFGGVAAFGFLRHLKFEFAYMNRAHWYSSTGNIAFESSLRDNSQGSQFHLIA
jgi:hypothetical protein